MHHKLPPPILRVVIPVALTLSAVGAEAQVQGEQGAAPTSSAPAASGARTSTSMGGPESTLGLRPPKTAREVIAFEEAMGAALKHNPDLRVAQERLFQAELLTRKAWANFLPRLNAGVGYTFSWPEAKLELVTQEQYDAQADAQRAQLNAQADAYEAEAEANRVDGNLAEEQLNRGIAAQLRRQSGAVEARKAGDPIVINPMHQGNGSLNFQFVLFNGRAIPLLLNAYEGVAATRNNMSRSRMQVLYMAAVSYFNAHAARRLEKIAQQQVARMEEHLKTVALRVKLGTATSLTEQRARADLLRARANVRTSRNAYEASIAALGMSIGRKVAFDVGELPRVPAIDELYSEEQLLDMAMHRPDVQAARSAITMADRDKLDALARWLPTVSLNAQGRATTNTSGFQSEPLTYAVTLNGSIPLYDGGERYIAWDEAKSKAREARISYDTLRDRLDSAIVGNLREINTRKENLQTYRESLEMAQKTRKQAELFFQVGTATQLEVLDATTLELSAELDLAQAELDIQVARLGLAHLVGSFDPAIERGGDESPVMASSPARDGSGVPALAPPGRAAVRNASLPLQPSAMDLVRHDVAAGSGGDR
ncbi:MAG: TolC family protein [Myxococcota bacterium]